MYKKGSSLIYVDGVLSKGEGVISLVPPFHGAFETILVKERRVFRLEEHIERLVASLKHLFKDIQIDPQVIKERIFWVLKDFQGENLYVRASIVMEKRVPHLIVIVKPFAPYPAQLYTKGVKIKVVPTRRNPPETLNPGIKSQDFLPNIIAKREASMWGAEEGVMCSEEGYITEGGTSNLFVVRDGKVKTSPTPYVLRGITRGVVFELLEKEGFLFYEEALTRYDLYVADEAFLTYTSAGIVPVVMVDGRRVGDGRPGPITKRLLWLYDNLFKEEAMPL
jgi:branched-chain amino acid aminotransferase